MSSKNGRQQEACNNGRCQGKKPSRDLQDWHELAPRYKQLDVMLVKERDLDEACWQHKKNTHDIMVA